MFGGKKGIDLDFDIGKKNNFGSGKFPQGFSFSPYAGYGTNNAGYALDGGRVSRGQHFAGKDI